ncbi:MAG: hypothetical protein M1608_13435, partial [Candidatus Omnitrophica bacterium]|nr:hypothetical protein [Candidatus Omnitrophota bacterium]
MKWTLYQAAREWNIDRQTLAKRLSEAGVTVGRGRKYHTREVTAAIVGRLESEKIRETKARANLLEIEQSEKSGRLVKGPFH